jgi:hypothetical protein
MKPKPEDGQTIIKLQLDILACHGFGFKQQTLRVTVYQMQFNDQNIIFKFNAKYYFLEYTQNWKWCINKWTKGG